jgi:hypothetical protein
MRRHKTGPCFVSRFLAFAAILGALYPSMGCSSAQSREAPQSGDSTETIVMIRHGEKPENGLGQISCMGLNRALALPDLLIRRYGKPDFVYAPNPSDQVKDHGEFYSYVRPLATIEPTAIRAGLPVNTQIGYKQIDQLQKELTQPAYANARIFIAWEHGTLHDFAQQFLKFYGDDPSAVPLWPTNDFDTIYLFHLTRKDGKPHLAFQVDHEDLNGSLSAACPAGAGH